MSPHPVLSLQFAIMVAGFSPAAAPKSGDQLERRGDWIVACGQLIPTSAPVSLERLRPRAKLLQRSDPIVVAVGPHVQRRPGGVLQRADLRPLLVQDVDVPVVVDIRLGQRGTGRSRSWRFVSIN